MKVPEFLDLPWWIRAVLAGWLLLVAWYGYAVMDLSGWALFGWTAFQAALLLGGCWMGWRGARRGES